MSKRRIILLLDGTWNQDEIGGNRSNIVRLRDLIAESLDPDIGAGGVLRKYGISSGQLYTWRRQLTQRLGGHPRGPATNFARVDVVDGERQQEANQPTEVTAALAERHTATPLIAAPRAAGLITRRSRRVATNAAGGGS